MVLIYNVDQDEHTILFFSSNYSSVKSRTAKQSDKKHTPKEQA